MKPQISREKRKRILTEIETARRRINTNSYSLSISEIISLYQEGDLIVPKTQDIWNDRQKTKFIEQGKSILKIERY